MSPWTQNFILVTCPWERFNFGCVLEHRFWFRLCVLENDLILFVSPWTQNLILVTCPWTQFIFYVLNTDFNFYLCVLENDLIFVCFPWTKFHFLCVLEHDVYEAPFPRYFVSCHLSKEPISCFWVLVWWHTVLPKHQHKRSQFKPPYFLVTATISCFLPYCFWLVTFHTA